MHTTDDHRQTALPLTPSPVTTAPGLSAKKWLAEIGRRGGRANKGKRKKCDPRMARKRALKAIRARWDKRAERRRRACLAIDTD